MGHYSATQLLYPATTWSQRSDVSSTSSRLEKVGDSCYYTCPVIVIDLAVLLPELKVLACNEVHRVEFVTWLNIKDRRANTHFAHQFWVSAGSSEFAILQLLARDRE